MGIKKKTYYVCDNVNCGKEGEREDDFVLDVPVQHGDAKAKVVLCKDCNDAHLTYMARYFTDDELDGTEEAPKADDYDPQTYPQMQGLTPADRDRHYKAKVWALGPDSTLPKTARPGGVRGKAGEKVLAGYAAYMVKVEETRRKVAEAEAAVAAPGAVAFKAAK